MATLELQQVKCPNCGANITSFNEFKTQVECPYCHTMLRNPAALAVQKSMKQPERIIPFTTREEDFGQHLVNALNHRNYVPKDIYDYLHVDDTIKAYLPMYLYEGKYQASWSGRVVERYEDDGKTKTRTRYVNGNAFGNFSFLCLAYEGEDIPQELRAFTATFPYTVASTRTYDPAIIGNDPDENLTTLAVNTDSELVWHRYGEATANQIAEDGIRAQAGSDIRDLQKNVAIDMSNKGMLVLVPFWFVYYNYQQNKFYFLMDGTGRQERLTNPEDQSEIKEVKKFNWLYWVTGLLILLGVIMIAAEVAGGGVFAAIGGIGLIISLIFINMRKKNILKASEQMRIEGSQRFLAGQ